jgi:iron complex outermembrane recepter protein
MKRLKSWLRGFFAGSPRGKILAATAAFLWLANVAAVADDTAATTNADLSKLADMDISQLMQVKVSILGPSESVSQTPAAVSVVTQDDIQRSGAMNIPEALRLVPGMDVAQVDSSQWAVSARGFNDIFADKLLVMQDGRDLYTPLYSGVFWDVQGTMMEDIDHIEVVRGPGATLWGANAMNGVINVITKSAEDTQGLLASGGGGNQERGFADVRYGGSISSNAFYRVYGTYENHDANVLPDGSGANDSWQMARGGFRTDWDPTGNNVITFQGDGYAGWIDQVFGVVEPPASIATNDEEMKVTGANVLGRWTHTISDTSDFKLQAYYDYNERNAPDVFNETLHTFDLDFKHEFELGERNKIVWGLGYRLTSDTEENTPTISFFPDNETLNLYSGFAQDEIALIKDRLSLTLGSKLEHNDYTGFEYEPGARLLWTPVENQTFWASVSRAVRTPSRAEESVMLPQPVPGVAMLSGTNTFESEELIAYEVGYRTEPFRKLSLDLTAFYNDYTRLRSEQLTFNSLDQPELYLANDLYGSTYGFEATATWRATDWWQWQPTYTLLKMDLHARSAAGYVDEASVAEIEGSSPENQFSIRSSMDLPHGVTFDTDLRYVDSLPYFQINSYFELDVRLAWQISKNWEVALVGQNLLHDQHAEFGPTYVKTQLGQVTDIPQSVYLKVTCRF